MSARLRLTLSYAGFLLVAGTGLVALLVYVLRFVPEGNLSVDGAFIPNRNDLLTALWPRVAAVLTALTVVGLVGGWFLAGRMLRPLHDMHAVARRVAAGQLDHRVASSGPRDEFRELADTFDAMLDRLQAAFDEQRRFAANASHELRTPYAVERAMLDVALADPAAVDVPRLLTRLDETNRRGTETVEALLALAALDQGRLPAVAPVDLAEVTGEVVRELAPLAHRAGVTVHAELGECDLDGVEPLVRHLVGNLVLNGVRHNTGPGGTVHVRTGITTGDRAQLVVCNTGPVVDPAVLGTLTEPFVRGGGRVSAPGSGLGLALVARVAEVHHAVLLLSAPSTGGLAVDVTFPPGRDLTVAQRSRAASRSPAT
ncbi:HAMP domain-containing protein [Modestobacter sp. I12A-02628]|uniref:histidine kinase n=1 Tax=Goekera deserti TaxID=2497753 RepID=A0A7K3WIN4_9ACTN|nr:HAMP domain-containing sensor histidine kinase [Goekera deserti]MPQ97134.1 HAMP domain-containing protein [Goekera deserti]NDI46548.1 HAMP domain-containing protein [Goekera deserti]NEL56304.1 HAMP domain-containing histidine kinase [Goekera deserti]